MVIQPCTPRLSRDRFCHKWWAQSEASSCFDWNVNMLIHDGSIEVGRATAASQSVLECESLFFERKGRLETLPTSLPAQLSRLCGVTAHLSDTIHVTLVALSCLTVGCTRSWC